MENLERKVYSQWAFTKNEDEKSKINRAIYEELKEKYKIASNIEANFDDYDLVYERKAGYNHGEYTIHKNETTMTDDELALIFDGGNLCFGYKKENSNFFYVFED